jgi:hypothetical protein
VLWHFFFESLAYFVAFRLYLWERRKSGDFLDTGTRWTIVVAAIGGAVAGSKILFWLEDPARTLHQWNNLEYLLGGKTVVGAILGGTIAVEWTKRRLGITRRTGDLFAVPLALGIAIGRVGCFLAGLKDDTHGIATTLAWGVDWGDGVRRHPVQLYESAAMVMLALALWRTGPPIRRGQPLPAVPAGVLRMARAGGFSQAGRPLRRPRGAAVVLSGRADLVRPRVSKRSGGEWLNACGPTCSMTRRSRFAPPVTGGRRARSFSKTGASTC